MSQQREDVSGLPPAHDRFRGKADMAIALRNVCFLPKADIRLTPMSASDFARTLGP